MRKTTIIRHPNMSYEQRAVFYVFRRLLLQLHKLFIYRNWLPIERCQICFYSETLSSLYQEFLSFTFTDINSIYDLLGRTVLNILVGGILKSKDVSTSFDSSILNLVGYQLALELNSVGYQLAIEVAEILKASRLDSGKAEKYQDLSSMFHFDKNKFQEREVFVGFEADASNLLQQLASITKKKLEVISIVGMAGLGKTTLAKRLYNDPYVVSYFYVRRSLIVVGKKGSNGKIKTCRIHDLLRDLCLRKVEEENFSPNMYKHNKHTYSCPHTLTNPSTKCQLLICTDDLTIPSNCSCYSSEFSSFFKDVSIVWKASKLIMSLDVSSLELFVFPSELLQLVHLRYLELRFRCSNPPECISHLRELRALVMSSRMKMVLPVSMWKMVNLKHLCIKSGENLVNFSNVEDEEASSLENIQTMSLVSLTRCQRILKKTRNLQKLGLCGPLTTRSGDFRCPDLGLLMHLETLNLLNTIPFCKPGTLSTSIIFPGSLKSITMSHTYLDWKESWVFEMMPNLEVLKLKLHAFVGEDWETCPEMFPRLKFLKLDKMDIVKWTASLYHFPVLQCLRIYRCSYVIEIPEDFGKICTLELIELRGCSYSATKSARNIQKNQESNGNDWLKILVRPAGLSKQFHKRSGY